MIDSHCHLGIDDFKTDVEGCLIRAKEKGVTHLLTVACDYEQIPDLIEMSKHQNVYTAFGIHPENAEKFDYQQVKKIFNEHPEITGVGETGLDYFYNPETKNIQLDVFNQHIELASDIQKPLIVHTRQADAETIHILKSAQKRGLLEKGGVMHCFCGTEELAKAALDVGFYISVSGIITFKNAVDLRDVIKKVPLERLLIETDAPYLAPVPFRGKRNEPSFICNTLNYLAEFLNIPLETVEKTTTDNFFNLFGRKI